MATRGESSASHDGRSCPRLTSPQIRIEPRLAVRESRCPAPRERSGGRRERDAFRGDEERCSVGVEVVGLARDARRVVDDECAARRLWSTLHDAYERLSRLVGIAPSAKNKSKNLVASSTTSGSFRIQDAGPRRGRAPAGKSGNRAPPGASTAQRRSGASVVPSPTAASEGVADVAHAGTNCEADRQEPRGSRTAACEVAGRERSAAGMTWHAFIIGAIISRVRPRYDSGQTRSLKVRPRQGSDPGVYVGRSRAAQLADAIDFGRDREQLRAVDHLHRHFAGTQTPRDATDSETARGERSA